MCWCEVHRHTNTRGPANPTLSMVRGFRIEAAGRISVARAPYPFVDVADLAERASLDARDRMLLADAGALRGLAGHRHHAHWSVAGIEPQRPLFGFKSPAESEIVLPPPTTRDDTHTDYATIGLRWASIPSPSFAHSSARGVVAPRLTSKHSRMDPRCGRHAWSRSASARRPRVASP